MNIRVVTQDGSAAGDAPLDSNIFAAKINVPLMHQAVVAQLAARRAGTHATKTRGEVSGGGAKPYRQKGTGRARHGSIREPQWVGGGTTFGPKPRDYSVSLNKKMKALALRSALSARAADDKVVVVDDLAFDTPKTKQAVQALKSWGVEGQALVVLTRDTPQVAYSFRNIPSVHVIAEDQLNTYDVLRAEFVVFTRAALDAFQARASALPGRRTAKAEAASAQAEPAAAQPEPAGEAEPAAAEAQEGSE